MGSNSWTDSYLAEEMKMPILGNGQFSGHLILEKKNFFFAKKKKVSIKNAKQKKN
jgi:hypothetical protein